MTIETVRVSQRGKEQLIKLKRVTGIKNWNVLCRWALTTSLADPTPPLVTDIKADSNVEMSWRTFAGEYEQVLYAYLIHRAIADSEGADSDALRRTLQIHLHRGLGFLTTCKSVRQLIEPSH